jgi:hypothetical protein
MAMASSYDGAVARWERAGPEFNRQRAAIGIAPPKERAVDTNLHPIAQTGPSSAYVSLLLLVLGWALGILSSPITDAIRRRSVKQRITRAIRTELLSLQDSFADVVIQVSRRRGVLTHAFLDALQTTLISSSQSSDASKTLRLIDDLLRQDEAAFGGGRGSMSAGPGAFLSLRVQGVPFLEAHLDRLEFYTHETQRRLLEIHAGTQVFGQYAEEALHQQMLTFDPGIGEANRSALLANIESCYGRAAEKASELVSQITALLHSAEMSARLGRR